MILRRTEHGASIQVRHCLLDRRPPAQKIQAADPERGKFSVTHTRVRQDENGEPILARGVGEAVDLVDCGSKLGKTVQKHWRGIVEVGGIVLGVVSLATGIGELAALGAEAYATAEALEGVAAYTGIAAGLTDTPACVHGEVLNCIAGGVALVAGASGLSKLGSETIQNLTKAISAAIGAGTTTLDGLMFMISNDLPRCPRSRGAISWT